MLCRKGQRGLAGCDFILCEVRTSKNHSKELRIPGEIVCNILLSVRALAPISGNRHGISIILDVHVHHV